MEEKQANFLRGTDKRFKHFLISCAVSLLMVGFLVGNAYLTYNVGGGFEPLAMVGMVMLIPPGTIYMLLSNIGLMPELRGRESFIESNPWLWIFCVIFYAIVIYMILRLVGILHRRLNSKKLNDSKPI